jgi:hypothetical protein
LGLHNEELHNLYFINIRFIKYTKYSVDKIKENEIGRILSKIWRNEKCIHFRLKPSGKRPEFGWEDNIKMTDFIEIWREDVADFREHGDHAAFA